jgi:hypothetical protein
MEDWNSWHEAIKASCSLIVSLVTLGLGWLFGQALTYGIGQSVEVTGAMPGRKPTGWAVLHKPSFVRW